MNLHPETSIVPSAASQVTLIIGKTIHGICRMFTPPPFAGPSKAVDRQTDSTGVTVWGLGFRVPRQACGSHRLTQPAFAEHTNEIDLTGELFIQIGEHGTLLPHARGLADTMPHKFQNKIAIHVIMKYNERAGLHIRPTCSMIPAPQAGACRNAHWYPPF